MLENIIMLKISPPKFAIIQLLKIHFMFYQKELMKMEINIKYILYAIEHA